MNNILITFLIFNGLILLSSGLVHYIKLEKGANGCKVEGTEIEVGGEVQDPLVCGVFVCQNTEGDALIHYCLRTIPSENCKSTAISTVTDFPQCCWLCVTYVNCG